MAGMLRDQDIEQFARPLGLVVLQYSNFDLALTRFLEAIQGIDDWRDPKGDPTAGPSEPLACRLEFLKRKVSDLNDPGLLEAVLKILQDIKVAIEGRHVCVHGTWFAFPGYPVRTRKFPQRGSNKQRRLKKRSVSAKGSSSDGETRPEPEYREWTPSEVEKVASRLCNATWALDVLATRQRQESRRAG